MRYVLIIAGLIAFVGGMNAQLSQQGIWLGVGTVFIAIGVATCEIVAAISKASSKPNSYEDRLDQFQDAERRGDTKTMEDLLKYGGVPRDIAERAIDSIMEDSRSIGD